jgi:hypothetical protein
MDENSRGSGTEIDSSEGEGEPGKRQRCECDVADEGLEPGKPAAKRRRTPTANGEDHEPEGGSPPVVVANGRSVRGRPSGDLYETKFRVVERDDSGKPKKAECRQCGKKYCVENGTRSLSRHWRQRHGSAAGSSACGTAAGGTCSESGVSTWIRRTRGK